MSLTNGPEMEEVLKNMKIGDTVFHNEIGHIHRVIGGWIYQFNSGGVFVPFVDEEKKNESEIVKKGRPRKGLELITK
jgi:hypothetical protein